MAPLLQTYYPEIAFGGFTHVDGTVAFYSRVAALTRADSVVLDIGCGRGQASEDPNHFRRALRTFKGKVSRVIGIDVDPNAAGNPLIDEFRPLTTTTWPVATESIDVAICDFVLEHVEDPVSFFNEARRVLAPGGYLCIRTPNRHGYVAMMARFIPENRHGGVLRRAQPGRKAQDVFPAYYRCNTPTSVRRVLRKLGWQYHLHTCESDPQYLQFSRVAYILGVVFQRCAPPAIRNTICVYARRDN